MDSFTAAQLEVGKWDWIQEGGGTASTGSGLNLTLNGNSGTSRVRAFSFYQLDGDFDARVNFAIGNGWNAPFPAGDTVPSLNGGSLAVQFGNQWMTIARTRRASGEGFTFSSNGGPVGTAQDTFIASTASAGSLRIHSVGGVFHFAFNIGGGWHDIASAPSWGGTVRLVLEASNTNAHVGFSTTMSEFSVSATPSETATSSRVARGDKWIRIGGSFPGSRTLEWTPGFDGCTYVLGSTSATISNSAGIGSLGVVTQDGCPWTAVSDADWLVITSGTPGNGSGAVGFTVALNLGTVRTGTMMIAGQTFTVTQNGTGPITFVTTTLNPVTVSQAVSVGIAVSNATPPNVWSISAGALPAGISIDTSTGQLTGSPTAPGGVASFTVKIVDSSTLEATQGFSWTVNPAPSITSTTLPDGTVGLAYSQTLAALDGTGSLSWSVFSGSLPTGLSLDSSGLITGTPMASGPASFTAKVSDANSVEATRLFTILVNATPPPVITGPDSFNGVIGVPFSRALTSTGGTGALTWALIGGSLPAGLSMNGSGVISGTPSATGVANFTVKATDTLSFFATKALAIDIVQPLTIPSLNLSDSGVFQSYTVTFTALGGKAPYTWSAVNSLPSGLTLGSTSGTMSGTLSLPGQFSFTLRVTDAYGTTATQSFSVLVKGGMQLLTQSLPNTAVGAPYVATFIAAGAVGSVTWSASGLPAGLSLDSKTGELRGSLAAPGEPGFTVTVIDSEGTTISRLFSVRVFSAVQIITESIPPYHRDQFATVQLEAAGGQKPFTWQALTPVPAGLQFFSSGILAGVASTPGTFSVTFAVKDANGISAQKKLDIIVDTRPAFRISSTRLLFDGVAGGSVTAPQQVEIGTTPAGRPFTVAVDASWIRTNLSDAVTPGVLSVAADPFGLVPGVFHGSVTVTAEGEAKTIAVDFTVGAPPTSGLIVDPVQITINTSRGAGVQHQLLWVNRAGSDPVTAQPGAGAAWLKVVVGSPALFDIQVDPSTLDTGIYQSFITVASGAASVRVPVRVTVGSSLFEVSRNTVALEVAVNDPGMAATASQQILVLNRDGEPRAWYSEAAAPWIRLDPAVGIARPRSPLDITASAIGLDPGIYQSSVIVTPRFNGNPLPVDVLFQVRTSPPAPQVSPAGLAFRTTDGGAVPAQSITLRNGTAAAMGFVTAMEPGYSSTWLTVVSPTGTVPAGGTFALPVSVKSQGLAAGQYEAAINIEFADQTVRVVRVLLTVASGTCKATALRAVWTRPGDHFQAQAGWPTAVEVMAVDNCGNPVDQGAVLVHFSDRSEPGLPLISAGNGVWTGTWTPALPHTSITGIADAQSLTGLKGQSSATGVVSAASLAKIVK